MKHYLQYGLAAAILFAVSASVSLWLNRKNNDDGAENVTPIESMTGDGAKAVGAKDIGVDKEPRVLGKPNKGGTEEAARVNQNLRDRENAVTAKEEAMTRRQKTLELLKEELRTERTQLDELHKQIQSELRAGSTKVSVEPIAPVAPVAPILPKIDFDKQREAAARARETATIGIGLRATEPIALKPIEKELALDEKTPPEKAVLILERMADEGKLATAVKALVKMDPTAAEYVLAELSTKDARLAAEVKEQVHKARYSAVRVPTPLSPPMMP